MKKLLTILIICFLLFSCEQEKEKCIKPSLYKKGDVVYIKPDSVRAVIKYVNKTTYNSNSVKYTYDIEFYVGLERYTSVSIDTVYFYNNKKLIK
jgi:hypothetical protein